MNGMLKLAEEPAFGLAILLAATVAAIFWVLLFDELPPSPELVSGPNEVAAARVAPAAAFLLVSAFLFFFDADVLNKPKIPPVFFDGSLGLAAALTALMGSPANVVGGALTDFADGLLLKIEEVGSLKAMLYSPDHSANAHQHLKILVERKETMVLNAMSDDL